MGNWSKSEAISGISALLLFLVLLSSGFTARAAVASASEARRANDQALSEIDMRTRPSIFISRPEIRRVQHRGGSTISTIENDTLKPTEDWPEDAEAVLEIPISNFGQLPALNADILIVFGFDSSETIAELKDMPKLNRTLIAPSETTRHASIIPARDLFSFMVGRTTGYFAVRVDYDDNQGRSWRSESAFEIQGPKMQPVFMNAPVQFDRD